MTRVVCWLCLLLLGTALSAPTPADAWETALADDRPSSITLIAGRIVRPNGQLEEGVAVVTRGGKITRVGRRAEVHGQTLRHFDSDSVICPGFIDVLSSVGAVGQNIETVSLVDPDADAADALNLRRGDFRESLESGVTAAMVVPAPVNLVSGVGICFRTFVAGDRLDVLRHDGPLVFAFGDGVWQRDRKPTSRAGALHELRHVCSEARAGKAHPRINAAFAGELDAVVVCPERDDVVAVRRALGNAARRFGFVHTDDAIELVDELRGMRQPVVVGPYAFESSRRVILGAAALANAGIEIAFRGNYPESPPDALRITAALAVRHGMDPAAARRALTVAPAKIAGVSNRIGAITPGKDADLVVFSQDPLRLDARVLEVYVKGVRVYVAEHEDGLPAGERP